MNTVLVEHVKRRTAYDAFDRHWHLLVPEYDTSKSRVLASSHDHLRHEYISRTFEFRFGQPFTLGAHTAAVIRRLRTEGKNEIADALSAAYRDADEHRPRAAFTHGAHQRAARAHSDIPADRQFVREAWLSTRDRSTLIALLATTGLSVRRGEKEGEHVLWRGETFIGSLRRFARISKSEMTLRMESPDDGRTALPEKLSSCNSGSYGDGGAKGEWAKPSNSIVGSRSAVERDGIFRGVDEIAENVGRQHGEGEYIARSSPSGNSDTAHTLGNRTSIAESIGKERKSCIQEIIKLSSRIQERNDENIYSGSESQSRRIDIEKTLSELTNRREEAIKCLNNSIERERIVHSSLNEGHLELGRLQDEIDTLRDRSVRKFLWFRWNDRKALQRVEQLKLKRQSMQESVRVTSMFVVDAIARVAKSESALKNVQAEISRALELQSNLIKESERYKKFKGELLANYPALKFTGINHIERVAISLAREDVDIDDVTSKISSMMAP